MQAVIFRQHGVPGEVLSVEDSPVPEPGFGQVRVRMLASPVNPSDLLFIEGRYGIQARLPATPGFEGVGVVEKSGGGILGWLRKGKRVVVLGSVTGNWAEQSVAPAKQAFPVPDDIPDDQAASYFVNPATAVVMTQNVLKIPNGAWLLQSAAGGALGKMIIKLGKRLGYKTVNLVRRREQVDELKALGADAVVVEGEGPLSELVEKATGQSGVRYAIDPVGGAVGTEVARCLAEGGTALLYGLLSGEPVQVDPRFMITGSKRVEGFWLADWAKQASVLTKLRLMKQIRQLIRDGVLTTEKSQEYPLSQVKEAVEMAARPGKPGKVVLRISS